MLRKELKFLTLGIVVLAIAVAYAAVNFSTTFSSTSSTTSGESGGLSLTYHAMVCPEVTRADGEKESLGCSHNLFTNGGRNATRDRLFTDSPVVASFEDIGIGNYTANNGGNCTGAPAGLDMNDTALCGEYFACGLDRLNVANAFKRFEGGNNSAPSAAGNWTIGGEFTFSGAGCTGTALVNGTGLYNATSKAGNSTVLFAENTFTTATLSVNDKINITWFIWIT